MPSTQPFAAPVTAPGRQHYAIEPAPGGARGGTLLVMPAWRAGASLGIKLVTVYPDNAQQGLPAVAATYLLLDAATGMPRALLDGEELTLRRTGAASALASRYLSAPDASRLTMVGTGRLAPHLIESHARVRPIREVRIWGRRRNAHARWLPSLSSPQLRVEAVGGSGGCGPLGRHRELRHPFATTAGARRVAARRPASRSGRRLQAADVRGRR